MPLDAATTAFLTEMAESGAKPIHESTPEEVRMLIAELSKLYGAGPAMARVEDHTVASSDGSFDLRVLVPEGTPRGIIIYYHGGGWVIGQIDEFDTLGRRMAQRTGCVVVLPGYRLAPEHHYPTAADDSYAALEWVDAHKHAIAGGDVPIVLAGDSAGGNLVAVTTLRARDRNGPRVAMQVLVYPVADADVNTPSYLAPENQLLLSRDSMIWFWDHYLPDAARRSEPDASPLRATSLAGLPPAFVILAEHDVLRDEGEAYAERLRVEGVPVEMQVYEGQMHAFFTLLMLPENARAVEDACAAIEHYLVAQPA